MLTSLFYKLPYILQCGLISLYNVYLYNIRNGGKYKKYRSQLETKLKREKLLEYQSNEFVKFLNFVNDNSRFYKKLYENINISDIKDVSGIKELPILNKEVLRKNIKDVYTIERKDAVIHKTGGTTGKPLEALFMKDDIQRRFAFVDNFRGEYGYELGVKTAWFSGKKILSQRDVNKNRFWKYDFINKVRYYSTFHINNNYLEHYLNDLIAFKPLFMVGFPSTMLEIVNFGKREGVVFPKGVVKAIFPTAETITKETRELLESFFNTRVVDQYASSEGAPFIFECPNGNYHFDTQTGVFEVLDENNNYVNEGRLVVTPFTTRGTPLIRYDIGDRVKLFDDERECNCGNENPILEKIEGRIDDFIYSPENGKINLGNISNTLKGVKGIIRFQVVQDEMNVIKIYVIKDNAVFTDKNKKIFLDNWIDRVGVKMTINLVFTDKIPNEKSGKFRIVKNNIKNKL